MEAQLKTTPKAETSRGCGMTPGKPFSWENLLLLGVIACLALSLLTYQYIAAARLLICYVALPFDPAVLHTCQAAQAITGSQYSFAAYRPGLDTHFLHP